MSFATIFSRRAAASRPLRFASTGPQRLSPLVRTLVTKRYTKAHEAIVYDDATNIGTVSVTNYAQESLGDVVFVEVSEVGTELEQGESIGAVESVKAASDIYAPVSGKIVEVNTELDSQPGLINKSPEDAAWLCKLKLSKPEEIKELLDEAAYKQHCES